MTNYTQNPNGAYEPQGNSPLTVHSVREGSMLRPRCKRLSAEGAPEPPRRPTSARNSREHAWLARAGCGHPHAFSASLSSFSLSSISHISSSDKVFFFLPSLGFFSRSLMAFFLSLSLKAAFFLTSILFPAPS